MPKKPKKGDEEIQEKGGWPNDEESSEIDVGTGDDILEDDSDDGDLY
ncbi:MAG TPA: hypothetical protein VJ103_02390 [Candidatus Paceibacterota bacterium]|nr:hypothetical protein [Candidatus Paceibacterota bacterium]